MVAESVIHQCINCKKKYPHGYQPKCSNCGGLVDVFYDLTKARIYESKNPLERYFDLLPILEREHLLSLGEGNTPCVHAKVLGNKFGLDHVYLKVESHNPTGSTKDRMAAVVLSLFNELGIREFSSSSTGNSSNALAYGIQKHPQFLMHLFLGEAFQEGFRYPSDGVQVHVLEGKNFTEASNYAKDYAAQNQIPFEGGFFNFARREGLKTAYFEAVEQIPMEINWYFQASSSAMGVYGTAKGAQELVGMGRIKRSPRMVCVQQESCAPMVRAFEEGSPTIKPHHIVHNPTGIAKIILRGDPSACYPYVYQMLLDTNGTAVSVSEEEILEARALLNDLENLDCCNTSATTIAALKKLAMRGDVKPNDCVLLNLTGILN